MFNTGDIIRHRKYGWYAFVLKVKPLYTRETINDNKPIGHMFKCHRFDCGGYVFNQLDLHMSDNYIKVS
jgi:hypothetical protein